MTKNVTKGSFTLPGESGYEELTLKLAEKWGADVIRDSDGTVLSDEILNAGYGIYSTICIIRDHNTWAKDNMDKLQQTFLMTSPKIASETTLTISLMDDFFKEQFKINDSVDSLKYWQVYDRTTGMEVAREQWNYQKESESVVIENICLWHKYTVSFMAYRIWEEISMYNHTTNHWDKEHLMQIDPMHVKTQEYMLDWMENWCKAHPDTTVVRFTSMFYNFVWIWGSSERNRHLFSDWGSYDFTVSPLALDKFKEKYGYQMTAEDFINQGKLNVTHMVANKKKLDWMEFINDFVITFGKKLIDITHKYNKLAYVFYDDSWVGIEPYNDRFKEFGFDGLIKCVFSGYEARLCAGVDVATHELRLHPYLFPVGLGGLPTFMEGGDPTLEAKKFWNSIRRALLRVPIDRIGLGGYLHLVEPYPDFCDYIEKVADEFRLIKEFHKAGHPLTVKSKVAVLHSWGKLRSWTLSGHFHETYMHDLIHINEALSGLPVDVSFISFEDLKQGALNDIDIVINAGYAGSAWSGGDYWKDDEVVEILTKWVYEGGTFLGVNEPSAVEGYDTYFRMAHILGIDKDTGARVCHGKWKYDTTKIEGLIPNNSFVKGKENLYLTDGLAAVLADENGIPTMTINSYGSGKGIYLSSYELSLENTRLLFNLILYVGGTLLSSKYVTSNPYTECAYYPNSQTLVVINNSDEKQVTEIETDFGRKSIVLEAYDTSIVELE
ncbi:1,3-beta-galactosyl-N-acetylhexosamine phosphorylase [Clostridium sp. Marseille-P299]|uniref:1,3-beta-galactosyl-N-acetylhexosamine phosphorylase n=1 Tax=Clostridium sp. Marseille-P299 TaxID=1805477 RepID=UPI00082EA15E|nr:1,3-beta-galactosyl-N-acetylhexosamine phosphorylase [Clostridium sp. Marseille-P299]